jgi:hypothetical protein
LFCSPLIMKRVRIANVSSTSVASQLSAIHQE